MSSVSVVLLFDVSVVMSSSCVLSSPSHVSSVGIVSSFDISIVALWGSLVVICHCAMSSSSLSWPHWVCAGAGCSSPLVHGGGPHCRSSVVVVGPHRCLCGRWAVTIVHVTTLSVHRCHSLWCPWWPLLTWHLDSKQWGVKVVFTHWGGRKQPDSDDVAHRHLYGW